ncbi:hypothetical protein O3G_MSEX005317 [Manduca sexta]|uniref:Uncharacterized protein n=1 Tax=Manduca sexta TaxID=7130 RepID=A0A921YYN2_MANSE|nr:hypothetical protein O3G_MSEX005317 [Manduca sexta]
MPEKYDPSALWVAISECGHGNIFQVYPKLLAQLLLQEEAARQYGDTSEAEKLILPSDREWRLTQYFSLVALQKDLDLQVSFQIAFMRCERKSLIYCNNIYEREKYLSTIM